ncbi:MAG: UDP-N-acetylmuramoyl-L-alanyl-D-glutamate--2,6-diaminopimelate ligase [Thermoguttaceae bacterium]|nr:UDP-N-acetylmuramoyl-L-alanyl-D-glutamate--2,6-diaminopimelate ligase [Thermoguttaceae bacterium]MDO4425043.1 UDP-N-acetylmuramoyl-L-alanyl-D-glutamate--2,6-diaminopimelate ligase [Planctomycetia bacterium]
MQSCYQGISPVSLRKVLHESELFGGDDYVMLNCVTNVEKIFPGDVYFALRTAQGDGHSRIDEAIERGAGAVVSEKMTENPFKLNSRGELVPLFLVPSTQSAYARACQALYRFPARQMNMIGITGTSGKTMTAFLIAAILGAANENVGLLNSLGCFDGQDASANTITTLPPKRTSSWLSRMIQNDCSHAVMEVSSQALAQSRLDGIEFQTICLTNIMRNHIDFHGSIDNYRKAKMRMFEYLGHDGTAILNADDPIVSEVTRWLKIPTVTYGMNEEADVSAMVLEQHVSEQTILLTAGSETLPLRTRIVGNHHLMNCLAAAAAGLRMGVDLATIVRGIESVDVIPGRMERLDCGQPFSVIVDSASTPEELKSTLHFLREVTEGRILTVFGVSGGQTRTRRPMMGDAASRLSNHLILTDMNPGTEPPEKIMEELLSGVQARCRKRVEVCHSREEAIQSALEMAEPGDCVLIAGKGNEKFQLIGREARKHDDREIARRWLYEMAD